MDQLLLPTEESPFQLHPAPRATSSAARASSAQLLAVKDLLTKRTHDYHNEFNKNRIEYLSEKDIFYLEGERRNRKDQIFL